jgi:hypothetical protein
VPSRLILPEGHKPEEGLEDHEHPEPREEDAHDLDPPCVRATQIVVAVRGRDQPAKRIVRSLSRGFVVQLGIKVRRVDREPQLPVGEQRGGDNQAEH